ncbi:MAG: mobile mystery protein B [Bacteroidetes bacterium]|nr:mobile mystery protein B [Bacteroidota bacterium]
MGLDLEYTNGQTPLEEDEKDGLLIPTITTRADLDEYEHLNIEEAMFWITSKTLKTETIFTEKFVRNLHKRMYGNVWKWAGDFRKTNKNLGVDKWQIPTELKNLCDDALYWVQQKTYSPDEIAIRFKHRIVSIHCFPNGNGRHSRLMADIIIEKIFNLPLFTWGAGDLIQQGDIRTNYIQAVKEADQGNFAPLISFSRS